MCISAVLLPNSPCRSATVMRPHAANAHRLGRYGHAEKKERKKKRTTIRHSNTYILDNYTNLHALNANNSMLYALHTINSFAH